MKKKIHILCTLGPSTLNKKFLSFSNKNVSLLRLNMSHISLKILPKYIKFIRKFSKVPICIDTEGAQIRTKVKRSKNFKLGEIISLNSLKGNFTLYPSSVYNKLKLNDILDIGFNDLKVKIIKKAKKNIKLKTISSGLLESNKGVHIPNRKIKLNYLTELDIKAIEVSKKMGIKNFALSFTNSKKDIKNFKKILPNTNNIFKIETKQAIKNLNVLIKNGDNFLIDRGDLSKEISIENIPFIQRKILKLSKKYKNKKIFIATNFLESMIVNKYPTRGEANDIFNSLECGASGLVLAAETAIGKYPDIAVLFLKKMIKTYEKFK